MILQTDIFERLNYVKKTGDRSTPSLVPISSVQTIPQLMEIYSPAALSLFLEEDALTMPAAAKVQVFVEQDELDIETALEEALRLGILNRACRYGQTGLGSGEVDRQGLHGLEAVDADDRRTTD